ncbi:hypothetical protein Tco_0850471 [Tanacetum coccineum]
MNDLGIREYQKEEIDIDYRRKCEDKIYELKDKFNGLSIEIQKIIQEAKELRESEARARSKKIFIDDDDDNLGFYAVHPNMIHIPVSQNVEPKDSLHKGRRYYQQLLRKRETIVLRTLAFKPSDSDDFMFLGNVLSPPIPISPIFCPSSTIPVVDLDLPLEEADVPSFSDDSMILSEYESFTFDDEPVMAEVNVFDEINTSELSYPGIGFPDFGSFMVQKLWKDKASPTISIDGLQSSLHK